MVTAQILTTDDMGQMRLALVVGMTRDEYTRMASSTEPVRLPVTKGEYSEIVLAVAQDEDELLKRLDPLAVNQPLS